MDRSMTTEENATRQLAILRCEIEAMADYTNRDVSRK